MIGTRRLDKSSHIGLPSVGHAKAGVNAWYGIRYAKLTGGRRFSAPAPNVGNNVAESLADVPVFPQLPGRLSKIMGFGNRPNPQTEDAFFLNVWAPDNAQSLPVLFFIHGGAWMTGGGAMEWYDGQVLAQQGMVVVTINYRIGPIGHLRDESMPGGSLPLPAQDILCALKWVNENISGFGGDPDQVTVAGQSAGAWYGHLLSTTPQAKGLLRKVAHLSMAINPPWTRQKQNEFQAEMVRNLGNRPAEKAPLDELLSASARTISKEPARPGYVVSPYLPTTTTDFPDRLFTPQWSAGACHAEAAYLRFTADESSAFFFNSATELHAGEELVEEVLAGYDPADVPARATDPSHSPYRRLVAASSWKQFQRFPTELAAAYEQAGIRSRLSVFTDESPLADLHSAHCFDLPFQFGSRKAWVDAPMLEGISDEDFDEISSRLVGELSDFVTDAGS